MQWCLGISEHWNGSEHLLKLIVWCLGMSLESDLLIDAVVSGHVMVRNIRLG
jgi:hypothetical protein